MNEAGMFVGIVFCGFLAFVGYEYVNSNKYIEMSKAGLQQCKEVYTINGSEYSDILWKKECK